MANKKSNSKTKGNKYDFNGSNNNSQANRDTNTNSSSFNGRASNKNGKSTHRYNNKRANSRNYQDRAMKDEYMKGQRNEATALHLRTNDAAWYMKYPSIAKDSASLVFGYPAGKQFSVLTDGTKPVSTGGLMTYYLAPSVGFATSGVDPINIAAVQLFNAVRREQTGTPTFEANDLMLMTLAVADVYSYILFLQFVYGVVDLITLQNDYTPDAILYAAGIDPQSIRDHRTDFRAGINLLISYAAAFAVPNTMEIFKRKAFLYQNIFCDGDDIKSTLYQFVPYSFYKYQEGTTSSAAGSLVHEKFYNGVTTAGQTGAYTYKQLLQFGYNLLEPLQGSEDVKFMSAAIIKAFGSQHLMTLTTLPEIYPIVPLHDTTVLQQFKNATIASSFVGGGTADDPWININMESALADVTQDVQINSSILVSTPRMHIYTNAPDSGVTWDKVDTYVQLLLEGVNGVGAKRVLSLEGSTEPGDVLEATRLMWLSKSAGPTTSNYHSWNINCGTEIVIAAVFTTTRAQYPKTQYSNLTVINDGVDSSDSEVFSKSALLLSTNGRVDYSPAVLCLSLTDGSGEVEPSWANTNVLDMHFDFNKYAIIDANTLDMMHRIALFSLMSM